LHCNFSLSVINKASSFLYYLLQFHYSFQLFFLPLHHISSIKVCVRSLELWAIAQSPHEVTAWAGIVCVVFLVLNPNRKDQGQLLDLNVTCVMEAEPSSSPFKHAAAKFCRPCIAFWMSCNNQLYMLPALNTNIGKNSENNLPLRCYKLR
jgi:hypothetical protein